jgi:Ca-activated chloride channel family protein
MGAAAWMIALASLQSLANPQPPPRAPQPSARTLPFTTQTVRIDLIAVDAKGRVLDNLKTSEFELRDDNVAQPIEAVHFVPPSTSQARLVAIFLDEYHVSPDANDRIRNSVERFIVNELRPDDLLVVMKPLDSIFAIKLTTDREVALSAVRSFEGRKGEYGARNAYERDFMAGAPARIEASRTQIALSALNALAVRLARFPDQRKALIVVTEGFGRVDRGRGLEYLPTVETVIRSADQGNVAIYPVSPRLPVADDRGLETVAALAAETAGRAPATDLDAGLRRALEEASGYYVLTYRVRRPEDGRFHAVQVQITRPGTSVRARKGYFAPSPDEALRASLLDGATDRKPPRPPEPAPHASPLIRAWFGTSRGDDGRTRVTFVWEPAARLTGERNRRVPSRLVLTALAPDDTVLFEGIVTPTGPGTLDDAGAPRPLAVFETPPGRLRLRMSIQDAARQVLDSDVRSITVRDMKAGVSIATPEVLRARNAREFRTLDAEAGVPVASREFSRTERLLVRFRAYGVDSENPTVTAKLQSKIGGTMRDLTVKAPSEPGGVNEIDVPLADLAAGDYLIQVAASGTAGSATDVIDFHVTP